MGDRMMNELLRLWLNDKFSRSRGWHSASAEIYFVFVNDYIAVYGCCVPTQRHNLNNGMMHRIDKIMEFKVFVHDFLC